MSVYHPAGLSHQYDHFESVQDFKWCLKQGGEISFAWNGKTYGISSCLKKTPSSPEQTLIAQIFPENIEQAEKWCDTAEEVLEYPIDGDRLREIITKVDVIDRTI